MPPPARPAILGGMSLGDDYDDPNLASARPPFPWLPLVTVLAILFGIWAVAFGR